MFAANMGLTIIFPLLPRLAAEAGTERLGWIFASYATCLIASQIVTGILADRLGARRVLVGALGFYAAVLLGFAVARGLYAVMAVRALEGVAVGAIIPAVMAIVAVGIPFERRGRAMGQLMGLGGIGFIVGPVLGALLSGYGLAWPFVVAAAIATAAMVANMRQPAAAVVQPSAAEATWAFEIGVLRDRLTSPAFWGLLAPLLAIKANFATLQGALPVVGERVLGLGVAGVSGLFVLVAVAYGVASPLVGRLADRYPARGLALADVALLGLLGLALSQAATLGPFLAAFAVFAVAQSAGYLLATKHMADGLGTTHLGRGLGLASALGDAGMVFGPVLLLPLLAWPGALFLGMAGVAALAIVATLILPKAEVSPVVDGVLHG